MTARWAWSFLLTAWATGAAALPSAGIATPGPEPAPIRVMTWNIHFGNEGLQRVASTVCAADADIVGLQEVDVHWSERSAFVDQATQIGEACGLEVRFGPIYSLPPLEQGAPPRQFGVAVLTRLPILSSRNHLLTRLSTQEEDTPPAPSPGFLQVTVDVGGTAVDVFVTHLDYRPDPSVRKTQVAEMLAVIGQEERPAILMGDMNAPPDRAELAPLFARLHDAWSASRDPGFTYPAGEPVRRIDYIFTRGSLGTVTARVLGTDASDHRPVIAELSTAPR